MKGGCPMEEIHPQRRSLRKRRKFRMGRLFFILFIFLLIGTLIFSILQYKAGRELAAQHEIPTEDFVGDSINVKNQSIENILVLGVDTRGEEKSRTDTMILVSWNKETKTVKVVSFMRDIYAQIPGYESYKL